MCPMKNDGGRANCLRWPTRCWATVSCRWPSICGSRPWKTIRGWTCSTCPTFPTRLERVDWRRDLHFQTCTNIDTLDYSSGRLNEGSKVVIAAAGPALRTLPIACDSRLVLPEATGFRRARVFLPGILVVEGPAYGSGPDQAVAQFCACYNRRDAINGFPLVVVADDSDFTTKTLDNFLWTTFTRSNPASDIYGVEPFFLDKHWGCFGSLVIDARSKPHHAPPLVEDPAITRRVDALAAPGRPLHGII